MHKLLSVYKPIGITPLEAIKKIKQTYPLYSDAKIGYAGRLDPLAHGVLLLMVDEETKKKDLYLELPKSYVFEVAFGIQTDSYDMLGLIKKIEEKQIVTNVNLFVNTFVNKHLGKQLQFYPPYSSKPVNGKPLFVWAKNGKLTDIDIPTKEIEIFDFAVINVGDITVNKLKQIVNRAIASVKGDFRQTEIKKRWDLFFSQTKLQTLPTATFKITCSSGTYVREIVNQMGKEIGCGATTLDIERTAVGEYTIKNTLKI